jgi:hypothetical protein
MCSTGLLRSSASSASHVTSYVQHSSPRDLRVGGDLGGGLEECERLVERDPVGHVVEVGDAAARAGELEQPVQALLARHAPDQSQQDAGLRAGEMAAAIAGVPLCRC